MRFLIGLLVVAGVLSSRLPGYPERMQRSLKHFQALQEPEPMLMNPPRNIEEVLICPETLQSIGGHTLRPYFPDGSCHNLGEPVPARRHWGATLNIQLRKTAALYNESNELITNRPSAREVSNVAGAQDGVDFPNVKGTSPLLIFFGQYLDHDYALTPELDGVEDERNIILSGPDRQTLSIGGGSNLIFHRSEAVLVDGVNQYVNINTPWIDLSNEYGDNAELNAMLIDPATGLFVTQTFDGVLGEFPTNNTNGMFLCGDPRCDENTVLFSWHTLFVRNHNRLVGLLNDSPLFDIAADRTLIYETARVMNVASYQSVFYTSYLPYLLGRRHLANFHGNYTLDIEANPITPLVFTTAAFRYGHSGLVDNIPVIDAQGNDILPEGDLILSNIFGTVDALRMDTAVFNGIFRGLGSIEHPRLDSRIVNSVRNQLFQNIDEAGTGDDLFARNIQRGRDHGLGTFDDIREAYGLTRYSDSCEGADCFFLLVADAAPAYQAHDNALAQELFDLYGDLNNGDIFALGMFESEWEDSLMGETFTIILLDQFNRARQGDRFWWEGQDFSNFTNVISLPYRIEEILNLTSVEGPFDTVTNLFQADPTVAPWVTSTTGYCEWWYANSIKRQITGVNIQLLDANNNVVMTVPPQGYQDSFWLFEGLSPETTYTCSVSAFGPNVPDTIVGTATFTTLPTPENSSASFSVSMVMLLIIAACALF